MSQFTYENANVQSKRETYEWDNTWIEQTAKSDARRVLYIGDSISCGTRRVATARSEGRVLFDGFGTSKALDNPYFQASVSLFAKQVPYVDAVIFNNGLHGWHLEDESEYRTYYEQIVRFLLDEFGSLPVYLVLTTTVRDEVREARVQVRNRVVREIAEKYSLPLIDLYGTSVEKVDLRSGDGVHYTADGYACFADCILQTLQFPNESAE